jgi:hypothetical protein
MTLKYFAGIIHNKEEIEMDEFRTIAKLWGSGDELDTGTDSNQLGGEASFTREAPEFETDGTNNYEFLFWNTGRHLTNKRRVRWNFSELGWGTWTATRWYGTPGGSGPPQVRVNAFSIGSDVVLSDSPIDASSSTFAAGSYPFQGDDHSIGTANGQATVVAKDPFNNFDFSGWLKLNFGGDDSGEFVESDAGSGGDIGGTGFYEHVTGTAYEVAQGTSAILLASYGYFHQTRVHVLEHLGEILERYPWWEYEMEIPPKGDPGPIDLIRLKILQNLLSQTRPESGGGGDFQSLIEMAPTMSPDQLKRAKQSIKTTLDLGKTALSRIEAQMKAKKKK